MERKLRDAHPGLRKTVIKKLALAVLRADVRLGDRSLPLAWLAEAGAANVGFEGQRIVLERVLAWLPPGMAVLLSADRCYPAAVLFGWRHSHGWRYRRRLKGKRLADPGYGDETTTGELAREVNERYLPGVPTPTIGSPENAIAARYPGATRAASPVAAVLALAGYEDRIYVDDLAAAYPGPSEGLRTGLVVDSVKPRGTDGDVGFYRLADDSVYVVNHLDGRMDATTLPWWEDAVASWD